MNFKIKNILCLVTFVLVLSSAGCTEPAKQPLSVDSSSSIGQTSSNDDSLNTWIGEYGFEEFETDDINGQPLMMGYKIAIFKEKEDYYVIIYIDGFQTKQRMIAKVIRDNETIKLVFEMYLPDNIHEPYKKGDVLLSLKKERSEIYTYWGKLTPMLIKNNASGKIQFQKNFEHEAIMEPIDYDEARNMIVGLTYGDVH